MSDAGNAPAIDAAEARKAKQAEDLARAKAAGWNDPTPFKYEPVAQGEEAPDETRDTAVWLSDAAVYAWDDEFGDVGEPNPELEKMLFTGEHLQRAGGAIKALSFEVNTEGPEKIQPVRNVSHSPHTLMMHVLTKSSSRTPDFTPLCLRTSSCASTTPRPPFRLTASRLSSAVVMLSLLPKPVSHLT
jgi:hypothetical protein